MEETRLYFFKTGQSLGPTKSIPSIPNSTAALHNASTDIDEKHQRQTAWCILPRKDNILLLP
jgi:hypothetical protein